jgi:phosphatidylglycerophosphatase A
MNPTTETAHSLQAPKPRFAFAFATVLGVGYLKPAPGTWGSVVGLFIAVISHPFTWFLLLGQGMNLTRSIGFGVDLPPLLTGFWGIVLLLLPSLLVWLLFAWLGVTTSTKVANFSGVKDPQFVVIDEVSGVHLTLILALIPLAGPSSFLHSEDATAFALYTGLSILSWKYLLAGFVLFRIFDIAKPFPCRRLENLPGGWGIMADDWMAGVYAAICLRLALHFHWI